MTSDALLPTSLGLFALTVIWILCAIYMSWKFYCSDHIAIRQVVKNTAMSYLTFNTIALVVLTSLTLSDVPLFWTPNINIGFKVLIIIIIVSVCIGYASLYLFAIARLYYSWHGTVMEISKCNSIVYSILSIVAAILVLIYASSYYLFEAELLQKYWYLIICVMILIIIINTFVAVSIIYIFASKLTSFAIGLTQQMHMDHSLTSMQLELIKVVTKHFLLNSISLILFNVAIPVAIIFYVWVYQHNKITYLLTIYLVLIFHTIEMICIMLGFGFNKTYYDLCCTLCHKRCSHYFTNDAKRQFSDRFRMSVNYNELKTLM